MGLFGGPARHQVGRDLVLGPTAQGGGTAGSAASNCSAPARAASKFSSAAAFSPIPVKIVVVTMFEVGEDTGDQPGELQYWVERDHLDRVYPLPAAYHSVRMNGDGEMAVLTGQGTAHAAATASAPSSVKVRVNELTVRTTVRLLRKPERNPCAGAANHAVTSHDAGPP